MTVAKTIFGHLGTATNIEAPFFVTYVSLFSLLRISTLYESYVGLRILPSTYLYFPFPRHSGRAGTKVLTPY